MILESGRRKYGYYADYFSTCVLETDPGVHGNERQSPRMQIAFLVAHMSMNRSLLDQHNFILLQMFVGWYRTSRRHVFRHQHQMLRAIAFRGDLEDESSQANVAGLGTPQPLFALIFLQQERLRAGRRSRRRPNSSCLCLGHASRNQHRTYPLNHT